ncbi:MAG: diacylglycerol kinase family protein [Kiritimatiellae bacterium]|nr:diacylglycerol kinase family protein [Kiritimatiellia bacterium]
MTLSAKQVLVLINPRSGISNPAAALLPAIEQIWHPHCPNIIHQFSHSADDGRSKARNAVAAGADVVLVIGGDGMVNSIGCELIGQQAALGVIPTGSGNGFARHFNIPLDPVRAAHALAGGRTRAIDVGVANGRPFFVTCGMAWDAALVRTFEKMPVRGILPYVFSAAYEYLTYEPQPFKYSLDGGRTQRCNDPIVFTAANLTQYGGGAQIAPKACADDGWLELTLMHRKDMPALLINLPRLFDGSIDRLPEVVTRRFRSLRVHRAKAAPIQLDGELVESGPDVEVDVKPCALNILIP